MDTITALASLLANVYTQLLQAQARIAELEQELAAKASG